MSQPSLFDPAAPSPPLARASDPPTSHLGAARIEPKRGTRKAQVLARLRAADGAWVDGWDLACQECGGTEGLRRLRELREFDGWPIEIRPHPHGKSAFQYRITDG